MKTIFAISLVVGLISGVIALLAGNLHVYRVTSGYSGSQFWIPFSNKPTEEEFLDAVISCEPLITRKNETTQSWRRAQQDGMRLCIKRDDSTSIVVAPYDASRDPDTVFLAPRDATKDIPVPRDTNVFDQLDSPGSSQQLIPTDNGHIRGIWLTEPSHRLALPVALVGFAYFVGGFVIMTIASICGLIIFRWFWYFLLRRISELSGVVRNNISA